MEMQKSKYPDAKHCTKELDPEKLGKKDVRSKRLSPDKLKQVDQDSKETLATMMTRADALDDVNMEDNSGTSTNPITEDRTVSLGADTFDSSWDGANEPLCAQHTRQQPQEKDVDEEDELTSRLDLV